MLSAHIFQTMIYFTVEQPGTVVRALTVVRRVPGEGSRVQFPVEPKNLSPSFPGAVVVDDNDKGLSVSFDLGYCLYPG